jgi:HlyD family secretion protein
MKSLLVAFIFILLGSLIVGFYPSKEALFPPLPFQTAAKRTIKVEVKTIGELQSARSIAIASTIKGDQGKIIYLISDGVYVQPGEVLVKIDPTPFEEKLEKLSTQVREQEAYIKALQHAYDWEVVQAEHENRTSEYEVETARLEHEKVLQGDGPQELSRLKSVMQKAWTTYDEIKAYSEDLLNLEVQGFLNPSEIKQAQKRLQDEKEAYEIARQQYDTYVLHIFPMLVKKGETQLKRAEIKREETSKGGMYKIAKAYALLEEGKQGMEDLLMQKREAERELAQTEIRASSEGMVVHREDYRAGQRRKPRVGDVLVKNQPLIELPDLSSMIVKTRVRETDLYKIGVDKRALIEVDAYPHLKLTGKIGLIGVLALSDAVYSSEDKYFEVRIALDESSQLLRPGMTARVVIDAEERIDVLSIPLHAVFEENHQPICYLRTPNGAFEKRELVLGIHNDQWVELRQGISEGDEVALLNPLTNS